MPPKAVNTNFTNRDMEILALAWQCFEDMPKVSLKVYEFQISLTPFSGRGSTLFRSLPFPFL